MCYFFKERIPLQDLEPQFIEETIVNLAKPLINEMFWLGKEMSASHVLRSLMCLLAGLPTIAEKKGKNSKHQHSVILSEPVDQMLEESQFYFSINKAFPVPEVFHGKIVSHFK